MRSRSPFHLWAPRALKVDKEVGPSGWDPFWTNLSPWAKVWLTLTRAGDAKSKLKGVYEIWGFRAATAHEPELVLEHRGLEVSRTGTHEESGANPPLSSVCPERGSNQLRRREKQSRQ